MANANASSRAALSLAARGFKRRRGREAVLSLAPAAGPANTRASGKTQKTGGNGRPNDGTAHRKMRRGKTRQQ